MKALSPTYLSLEDMYLAYRKAKADAFYENTHFNAIAFANYEEALDANLRKLLRRISSDPAKWIVDPKNIGGYFYSPKSVEVEKTDDKDTIFFKYLNPIEDWKREHKGDSPRSKATFRLLIEPTVDFHVFSALWILKVGHKYDEAIDSHLSYGNRLRRRRKSSGRLAINIDCPGLFPPYFSAYARWRKNAIDAVRNHLKKDERLVVVTMDLRRFYHNVNPEFLLRKGFLSANGISLEADEVRLTEILIAAMSAWYRSTPDAKERPEGAIPIGLSASKIIANVLLAEFDRDVRRRVDPIYYGRYVDDIILAVRLKDEPLSGEDVMYRLAEDLSGRLAFRRKVPDSSKFGLKVLLPYAQDSELFFTGSKQKVFNLSGESGLDLITQITEQIRKQASEHRLLPLVPSTSEGMASKALLAQPSTSLEVDAIRKADVISVRRLGLSLLLRDMESYARDLAPSVWKARRREFYGLTCRHLVTPRGFFDYSAYLYRIFALMIACADFDEADKFLTDFMEVVEVLRETTTSGAEDSTKFAQACSYYGAAFLQSALQATTVTRFPWAKGKRLLQVLGSIRRLDDDMKLPAKPAGVRKISERLLHSDWGRKPYRDYWLARSKRMLVNPPVPSVRLVRKILTGIGHFRKAADLPQPYWPGVVFPTRPPSLSEITAAAPNLMRKTNRVKSALFAFRGARTKPDDGVLVAEDAERRGADEVIVPHAARGNVLVAVPSVLTELRDWERAAKGRPNHSLRRYESLRGMVSNVMAAMRGSGYVVFPECSVPFPWARSFAFQLSGAKVSMVAGLEYRLSPRGVRNDALISLVTKWPHYWTSLQFVQPKTAPSHGEKAWLKGLAKARLYRPRSGDVRLPVYHHGDFSFGVLICSDMTDIACRERYRGSVDALFIPEWNKDLPTFQPLVESAANDLHAYIVQVNNRQFGDSRIRAPREASYERDVMVLKGGLVDFFAIGAMDVRGLRAFQRSGGKANNGFKPLPIGFRISERRK